jgi:hypothetical protein
VSDREVSIPIAVTATLPAGEVVALVIRNVDPDPINNWISANCFTLNDGTSRVLWAPDMKVLDWKSSRGWAEYANSPVFDVTYSDGGHDGQAYYAVTPNYYGTVNGSQMIRERFTPTSDVTIGSASVRVKRTVGTGAIVLSLKQGTTQLAVGSVAASFAPISPPPDPIGGRWDEASLAGGRWATITFPAFTLTAGTTYDLVVSTDSATTYLAIPIRENAGRVDGSGFTNSPPSPVWGSRAFREGQGEKYNGSWVAMYDYAPHDLQFYFE